MHADSDRMKFQRQQKSNIMHAINILHQIFKKILPFVHKIRLLCLMQMVETIILHNKLSLTSLGRNISNKASVRDNIKKVDRLLKNKHLHNETHYFYQIMATLLIAENRTPWIHVDWSCLSSLTNLYMLRASLSLKGRSIVLYEEVHHKKYDGNHAIHMKFLDQLKSILPLDVRPIIVTDAGFRAPWFKYVRLLGWHFVGRLRSKNLVYLEYALDWQF